MSIAQKIRMTAAAAEISAEFCFWNAKPRIAALIVTQKFLAAALNPDMREMTPWIIFKCATLRSTNFSVVGSAMLNSPGFDQRHAHGRKMRTG